MSEHAEQTAYLPPIDPIARRVANRYKLSLADLRGDHRSRFVARPRQIAYMLASEETKRSLPSIGRYFRRDHTTVLYGIRAIRSLVERDAQVAADVAALRSAAHA